MQPFLVIWLLFSGTNLPLFGFSILHWSCCTGDGWTSSQFWNNIYIKLNQNMFHYLTGISLTVCIYFNWIMYNNLLFIKLNWCHWGLLVTIGMRLTSITLHYTPSCVDSEHCVYATVWMWTITITSNETWQNKPGLGSKGEHSRHSPGIPRSEYWVSNKLWELLHFFWPLIWIVNKLFGEGKLESGSELKDLC